jgi:O-antigen/teichoic acid export membrane protein
MGCAINVILLTTATETLRGSIWNDISKASIYKAIGLANISGIAAILISWMRSEQLAARLVITQISAALVMGAASIFCIRNLNLGIDGAIIGLYMSALVPIFAMPKAFWIAFNLKINKKEAYELMRYAVPIFGGYVAHYVYNRSSILMLKNHVPDKEIAVYGLVSQISAIIIICSNAFGSVIQPCIYRASRADLGFVVNSGWLTISRIIILASSLILLFAVEIMSIAAPQGYHVGLKPLAVIMFGNIAYSLSIVSDAVMLYHKKPKLSFTTTAISAFISLISGILLIPKYHISGAVIAMLLGGLVKLILQQFILFYCFRQSQIFLAFSTFVPPVFSLLIVILLNQLNCGATIYYLTKAIGLVIIFAFVGKLLPKTICLKPWLLE